MVRFKLLTLLLPMLLMQLCSTDETSNDNISNDCENTNLEITSLEEAYDCNNTKHSLEIDLNNNFTVIRSQSEFIGLVTGDCQATIDFSTYDLAIGKLQLANGNDTINYHLILNCETSNLELSVNFQQNETNVAPNLTYHALIPKLSETQALTVDIQIN
ncbi:hypothetical protein [Psychroserpens sp.]